MMVWAPWAVTCFMGGVSDPRIQYAERTLVKELAVVEGAFVTVSLEANLGLPW